MAYLSKTFKRVNPREAAGPGQQGSEPRSQSICAESLQIYSISPYPICFKMSTIVPVPKKAKVTELNDYGPVAFTSEVL
jgi:hypothetical protein